MRELFKPNLSVGVVATSSATAVAVPGNGDTLRIAVSGDEAVFIKLGKHSNVSVTLSDGMPFFPGCPEAVAIDQGQDLFVSVITESGSSRVTFTQGVGEN